MSPIYADILLVLACFIAGYCGGAFKVWALRRTTLDIDYRLSDLEGRVVREVKIRAGSAGQKALKEDQALLDWAKENTETPAHQTGPTLKPLHEWRRDKMIGPK